jgi:flavin reductase (DIM6/NTAB) family NADH-FMN oxidoreductase RutF/rubredoxin
MDFTATRSLSYGLYVVGVKNGDGFGGCIVDALVQATSDKPPALIVCSVRENLTNTLIHDTGELTISVLPENVDPFIVANFGLQSARDVSKWDNVAHTVVDGLPYLDGAVSYLRCKVTDAIELSTHTAFVSLVTDARRGESTAKPMLYADYQANMKDDAKSALKSWNDSHGAAQGAKWVCKICGHVYSGETPFEQLPDDWRCPICGVGKELFGLSD